MVVRVAERARDSGARDVYVATDHGDIAAAVGLLLAAAAWLTELAERAVAPRVP